MYTWESTSLLIKPAREDSRGAGLYLPCCPIGHKALATGTDELKGRMKDKLLSNCRPLPERRVSSKEGSNCVHVRVDHRDHGIMQ